MGIFSSLSYEQREATAILQIGTFLEYFDLMIYVHMAVLLNELFFPKAEPHIASLVSAATFCSIFVFRPLGALLFGYIGDTIGRKATIVITTIIMAFCCVVMATLPTYAQIGITAAWVLTICRIIQGLSSMGEIIGAQIYLTELIHVPARYPAVCLTAVSASFGGLAALGVATGVFSFGIEWRAVFWIGALIAVVGTVARTALRETPDFLNSKFQLNQKTSSNVTVEEVPIKVNQKTSLAYFFIQNAQPVKFYFLYVHCANILKNTFNYTPAQIIRHNLNISLTECIVMLIFTYLSYRIYPLKIVNFRWTVFAVFMILIPFLLNNITVPAQLMLIQMFVCLFHPTTTPAPAIFFIHFPILKRFRYAGILYALSRALLYIVTSFGFVYLTNILGHWGLLVIFVPILVLFKFGTNHFEKLEKQAGNYPEKYKLESTEIIV